MAARKKTAGRAGATGKKKAAKATKKKAAAKAPARKTASKKVATTKKAAATKKVATRKVAAPRVAAKAAAPRPTPPAREAAPTPPPGPSAAERLAAQIVGSRTGERVAPSDLYAPRALRDEAGDKPAIGLPAIEEQLFNRIEEKLEVQWTARHTFVSGDTIAIEWEAEITSEDGRVRHFAEVAIYETSGGRIDRERVHADPRALAAIGPELPDVEAEEAEAEEEVDEGPAELDFSNFDPANDSDDDVDPLDL